MTLRKTKNTKKETFQFETVQTLREWKTYLQKSLEDYNKKILRSPLSSGKEFAEEFKSDPLDAFMELMGDGKDHLKKLGENTREIFTEYMDNGKEMVKDITNNPIKFVNVKIDEGNTYIEGKKKENRKRIQTAVKKGKIIYSGLQKDADKIIKQFLKNQKKYREQLHMPDTFKKKIIHRLKSVLSEMNLPDKKELEKLVAAMDAMNQKVKDQK